MATIETALTRLLGIQHPILLAPMGSAAGGKLGNITAGSDSKSDPSLP